MKGISTWFYLEHGHSNLGIVMMSLFGALTTVSFLGLFRTCGRIYSVLSLFLFFAFGFLSVVLHFYEDTALKEIKTLDRGNNSYSGYNFYVKHEKMIGYSIIGIAGMELICVLGACLCSSQFLTKPRDEYEPFEAPSGQSRPLLSPAKSTYSSRRRQELNEK